MSAFSIRKSFGHAFALGGALLVWAVLSVGSLQAQSPLDQFKAFLTNPPPIEEIVFERKLLLALPAIPGATNMVPTGTFFQLRLQTNAYFLRQMQIMGEAPTNHHAGNMLEGEWNDAFWILQNNQLNLWHSKNDARLKIEVERNKISNAILSLGLDERINQSTIVWHGDTFTAQGIGGARFEGRIESKTTSGLPTRVVTWAVHEPSSLNGVEYEYLASFHPWFPVAIKPFFESRSGMPFVGKGTGRVQEFYIRSFKTGSSMSQDNFLSTLFTNANTLTIIHTKAGIEVFSSRGKLPLVSSSPKLPSNNILTPPSASPASALVPSTPLSTASLSSPTPSTQPPSSKWLVVALLFLATPPLIIIFLKIKAN